MSRWFRVDDGLVDDPKVQQLPDRLIVAMLNLWCITSQCGGNLPPIAEIAFKLRITPPKVTKLLSELRAANLIDDDDEGTRPHNWKARQFKSDVTDPTNAERQRRYRNRDKTVTQTVTVTPTRAETEQNITERIAADAAATPGKYAFEHGIIRLTPKDFTKWEKAYSHLDLSAELIAIEPWAAKQANWFHAIPGALNKKNAEFKHRATLAKQGGPQLPLTRAGNPWPEGIV